MKMEKKKKELEKLLTTECPKYENDCKKCPYDKECNEYEHLSNKTERR